MQNTKGMSIMSETIEQAKAEFNRAKGRITKGLKATPEDKLNWAPSDSARTPLQLVAHAAMGTKGIAGMLQGKERPPMDIQEMDKGMRASEKQFTSVDQVLGLLESTSADYFAWLDTLSDEQVNAIVDLPFGPMPMAVAITIPADHMRGHASQLEYVQTVYGDYEWRF
jgi:hypothetical protein